jgi:hypothetical protein
LTPCLTWDDGGYLGGWGEVQATIGGCGEAEPVGEVAVEEILPIHGSHVT